MSQEQATPAETPTETPISPEQAAREAEINAVNREVAEFINYKCQKHGLAFTALSTTMGFVDARGPKPEQAQAPQALISEPQQG